MTMKPSNYQHCVRVYWEDTDAGGIVFYANYLKFMERARTEWLRSLGLEQSLLKQQTGGMFVVTETALKYLQPARLDDELRVDTQIIDKGRASLKISQKIWLSQANNYRGVLSNPEHSQDSGMPTPLVEGTICIAWVNAETFKPGKIPSMILDRLS